MSFKIKSTTMCAALAGLMLGACTPGHSTPKNLPPGEYTHTEQSTNAAGTETKRTTNTNVYYDENGNKRAVQETETTRDPKGLFNKSTSNTTQTYN